MNKQLKIIYISITMLLIIVGEAYFGYIGKPTEMGLVILAGAIILAFLNLDKISRFKGAGFEAEMKKAVEEAYATTETVKNLAKTLAIFGISSLSTANRWGGMKAPQKHAILHQIDKVCEELDIYDPELDEVREHYYYLHSRDHLRMIQHVIREDHKKDREKVEEIDGYFSLSADAQLLTVTEVNDFVVALTETISPEASEAIANYEYYLKNRKLRRENALVR